MILEDMAGTLRPGSGGAIGDSPQEGVENHGGRGDGALEASPPMPALEHVKLPAQSAERFAQVLDPERYRDLVELITHAREVLAGHVVWNVNSTARGGGVAELLASLLAYTRGAGV